MGVGGQARSVAARLVVVERHHVQGIRWGGRLGLTSVGLHVMNTVQVPAVVLRIMQTVWDARGARVRGYDIRHDDV